MIEKKAGKIKLFILDVDGVMTDGQIMINEHGEEIKSFDVKDGLGIRLLMNIGVEVVIISGRKSKAVEYRAEELGIKEVYQSINDKKALCAELIKKRKLDRDNVCCIGDDLPDIPMFNQAGISIAVADAVEEVRNVADLITKNKGGNGAIREACELVLKAKKAWPDVLANFS